MFFVEGDQFSKGAHRRLCAQAGIIGAKSCLKIIEVNVAFTRTDFAEWSIVKRFDYNCASLLYRFERILHNFGRRTGAQIPPCKANPRSPKTIRLQKGCI